MAPEVGVDGDGLPAEGEGGGIGEAIEAAHEAGGGLGQEGGELLQEVGRNGGIGVADDDEGMAGEGC